MMMMFMGDPETFRTAIPGQRFLSGFASITGARHRRSWRKPASILWSKDPWSATPTASIKSETLADNEPVEHRFDVTVPEDAEFTDHISRGLTLSSPTTMCLMNGSQPAASSLSSLRLGRFSIRRRTGTRRGVRANGTASDGAGECSRTSDGSSRTRSLYLAAHRIVPLESKEFPVAAVVHSNVKGPAKGKLD